MRPARTDHRCARCPPETARGWPHRRAGWPTVARLELSVRAAGMGPLRGGHGLLPVDPDTGGRPIPEPMLSLTAPSTGARQSVAAHQRVFPQLSEVLA